MIPSTLTFLYSYKCNFSCKHCSVPADSGELLPINILLKAIDDAYEIPSIHVIVFTGGEPTLFPNHLKTGIKYAADRGFVVRLVTNAWWAESYEKAKEFLDELRSLGLKELNISYDDFHLEWLNKYGGERNVINAVKAAVDLGLTVLIGITKIPDSKITSKYVRNLLKSEGLENVMFIEDFIAPFGRAKTLRRKMIGLENILNVRTEVGCRDIGTSIAICPDGKIVACCGHIFSSKALEMFTIGNIKDNSLATAITRMQRNVLYWWIALRGPQEILRNLNYKGEIYHKCEACSLIWTYKEKLRRLAQKKEDIFHALVNGEDINVRV